MLMILLMISDHSIIIKMLLILLTWYGDGPVQVGRRVPVLTVGYPDHGATDLPANTRNPD